MAGQTGVDDGAANRVLAQLAADEIANRCGEGAVAASTGRILSSNEGPDTNGPAVPGASLAVMAGPNTGRSPHAHASLAASDGDAIVRSRASGKAAPWAAAAVLSNPSVAPATTAARTYGSWLK